MKYFKNITKQDIKEKIGGKEVIVKAGEAIKLENYYAEKFARSAAQRELFAQKYLEEQKALEKGQKINSVALSKKLIEETSKKYLKSIEEKDVVSIEDLEEEKPKKKTSKKKEVVIEEDIEDQEIDDDDFVDQE